MSESPPPVSMRAKPPSRTGRKLAGVAALVVLAVLAAVVPQWDGLRVRGVVGPSRTLTLKALGEGVYEWTEHSGSPAAGPGLVRQKVMRFERSDMVEIALDDSLRPGTDVNEGTILARFTSPRHERLRHELAAEKEALAAKRALLAAGGRPEEIAAARKRVSLAEARREFAKSQLDRLQGMGTGVVGAAELDAANYEQAIQARAVEVERATLAVAQSSARPEALAALDARIQATVAHMDELDAVLDQRELLSPFAGTVQRHSNPIIVRVVDMDVVYVHAALPEARRAEVQLGGIARFAPSATPGVELVGTVEDISVEGMPTPTGTVFFVSARFEQPQGVQAGMSGEMRFEATE